MKDGIIARCSWGACGHCRHGTDGCRIDSDDFRLDPVIDCFVCENFEKLREDEG